MAHSPNGVEPIAIVGLSFKFAGDGVDSDGFWQMIADGRSAAAHVPGNRFKVDNFYHPDTNRLRTLPTREGYFLRDDIAAFDAPFFSITAAEAAAMDPQSRILLETSYRALENAGIPIEKCAGTDTSVHIGCSSDDYKMMYLKDPERPIRHAATGMAISMLANKISWFYDINGPSMTIDTACSASLNALHLSCDSLRNGDSSMGLVGGVNLFFTPESMSPLAHMNFFSPDGQCYSFDHRANGYARGEGFGVVVIKRLTDALRDGDTIRAVIRATGSNENGRTTGGITQVNAVAQESLIRKTYSKAKLNFDETRYVEAHGPGTGGDVVEAAALAAVFSSSRSMEDPLYMGSCKANIGHLEGGSGMAGLIKTILVLERGIIPRLANFEQLHPRIAAGLYPFKYPTENMVWPPGLRRASLNSFGFGGSNAHVILEDAHHHLNERKLLGHHCTTVAPVLREKEQFPVRDYYSKSLDSSTAKSTKPHLLIFSASNESSLERNMQMFSTYAEKSSLEQNAQDYLQNLAYTLAIRRSHHPWRLACVVESIQDLARPSSIVARKRIFRNVRVAYIFTGQGAQFAQMGLALMRYKVFHKSLLECQDALMKIGCSWSLEDELSYATDQSNIQKPEYSQATTTALQISLVNLLRSFGIKPSAVIGHSSGEIAAAYSYGAISLAAACKIAYLRGIYASLSTNDNDPRGMMAVGLGHQQAAQFIERLEKRVPDLMLSIACVNSVGSVTISGLARHLRLLKQELDTHSVFAQMIMVNVAYHSPYMNAISKDYRKALGIVDQGLTESGVKFYSTSVAGDVSIGDLCSADYWVNNLLSQVHFSTALIDLCRSSQGASPHASPNILIEIGPHSALRAPVNQNLGNLSNSTEITYYAAQLRNQDGNEMILRLLGSLYCAGYPVKLDANELFGCNPTCLTDLPEYQFDHSRSYWHESRLSKNFRFRKYPASDLLGTRVPDWNPLNARWRHIITTLENPWIEDHLINGTLLYPGAGQLVMAIEASAQYALDVDDRRPASFCLKDVVFIKSLNVSLDPDGVETEISLTPLTDPADRSVGWSEFRVCVYQNDGWTETCRGQIILEYEQKVNEVDGRRENCGRINELRAKHQTFSSRCTTRVSSVKIYRRLKDYGLELGSTFKVFEDVRHSKEHEAMAEIRLRQWMLGGKSNDPSPHFIHPTALDGALQLGIVALSNGGKEDVPTMVPSRIGRLWLSASGLSGEDAGSLKGCAKSEYRGYRQAHMEITALDQDVELPRIIIEGLETIIIGHRTQQSHFHRQVCYTVAWHPLAVPKGQLKNDSSIPEATEAKEFEYIILVSIQSSKQNKIARKLKHIISVNNTFRSKNVLICSLAESSRQPTASTSIHIFLNDLEEFSLSKMSENTFVALKRIISNTKTLFWAYSNSQSSRTPISHLTGGIQGLARTWRSEYEGLKCVSMGLEINRSLENTALAIAEIIDRTLSSDETKYEPEYLQSGGMLHISRLVSKREMDETISKNRPSIRHESRSFASHPALKLSIGTPGLLDTLQFEQDDSTTMPLLAHEIEVKPIFCGINFMDCLVALGRVPHTSLGVECAGIVVRAGAEADFSLGDKVMLCSSGTVRSVVRCHYNTAAKVPDDMPFEEAAALPATAGTVYHALHNIARLQACETILIHAGAGATGQLAIQMAINLGAVVLITVGSTEKKSLVMERYKIPEHHIFYSRDASFTSSIRRVTSGRGVDVVINSLAGDNLVASWECIAPFGRFIEIGKRDIYAHKQLPMFPFARNVTFSTIDLTSIWRDRPALMRQILDAVVSMVVKKEIEIATPLSKYSISNVEGALRLLQSGKNMGKVVIDMQGDAQVLTCLKVEARYTFDEDGTYVIAGGLGGLGKSAAKWLVSRGARHLLLLSRSGPKTDADFTFIADLKAQGVCVCAPLCDITNYARLSKVIKDCSSEMPPIKGCIQAAMILRDRYFSDMNHTEWKQSVAPKIDGSWHLHSLLPSGMDFFVFFSSISSIIGGVAQANYAAGNAFMDCLARYRVERGEKAVSLNLGLMRSEGVVSENEKMMRAMESRGYYIPLTTDDFYVLLDKYCDPALPILEPDDAQIVCGIERPVEVRRKGVQVPVWMRQPLFNTMWTGEEGGSGSSNANGLKQSQFQHRFEDASTLADAGTIVSEELANKLSRSLMIPVSEIDPARALHLYGVDSLVAVELRNWFANELHADVAIFEILGNRGCVDLGSWAAARSRLKKFDRTD